MASSLNFPDKTFIANAVTILLFNKVASLQIIWDRIYLWEYISKIVSSHDLLFLCYLSLSRRESAIKVCKCKFRDAGGSPYPHK